MKITNATSPSFEARIKNTPLSKQLVESIYDEEDPLYRNNSVKILKNVVDSFAKKDDNVEYDLRTINVGRKNVPYVRLNDGSLICAEEGDSMLGFLAKLAGVKMTLPEPTKTQETLDNTLPTKEQMLSYFA